MISKSDYMLFLRQPAWLWMKKRAKAMLPEVSEATQAIFDTGHAFEAYAEALYPGGVTLGFADYDEYITLPARTKQALDDGVHTIFQGRFEHENLTFICDIVQVVGDREVDLIEIKSSTSAKADHIVDLAFQMVVLEKCGYSVRNISVIHVNNQYVRNGAIDPKAITAQTDVTEQVKEKREFTLQKIDEALAVVALPECPDTSPLLAGDGYFKEWLEVYKHIKKTKPGTIYDLCQMDKKTLQNLQNADIQYLKDIPSNFELKLKQKLQVEALRMGRPTIKKAEIKEFLDSFVFPLYFFDYETLSSLVPYFDGMRPYAQYPFQYSLHILDSPEAKLKHVEYLHTENSNPAEAVVAAMQSHFGDTGSVIAWNMGFEKGCNDSLAQFVPEAAEFLANINSRMVDLMIPFSQSWYVDADFCGSASIKNVLPVLVPELSHKDLDISDGSSAQRLWMEAVLDGKHPEDKQKILRDLLDYCKLDTLAMVEIFNTLRAL
jgi:hypothetical protein